jgi:hypothetical protein
MNNKIYGWTIGAVIVGLVIWYGATHVPSQSNWQAPDTTAEIPASVHEIKFFYPESWGPLKPFVPSQTSNVGEYVDINTQRLMGYPYKGFFEQYATVTVEEYPAQFKDDEIDPSGPGGYTAKQKQAILQPLLTIYNQRDISGLRLVDLQSNEIKTNIKGWWWGNEMSFQHRMNPLYFEDDGAVFRGVGFFSNENQEGLFYPAYTVLMINPAKHVIVRGYFPVTTMKDLAKWVPATINSATMLEDWDWDKQTKLTEEGEAYLNNPSGYSENINRFIADVGSIMGSISLVK